MDGMFQSPAGNDSMDLSRFVDFAVDQQSDKTLLPADLFGDAVGAGVLYVEVQAMAFRAQGAVGAMTAATTPGLVGVSCGPLPDFLLSDPVPIRVPIQPPNRGWSPLAGTSGATLSAPPGQPLLFAMGYATANTVVTFPTWNGSVAQPVTKIDKAWVSVMVPRNAIAGNLDCTNVFGTLVGALQNPAMGTLQFVPSSQ